MKQNRLKIHLIIMITFLCSAILIMIVFNIWNADRNDRDNQLLHDIHITNIGDAYQLKLTIIQVQQWLTDISATRGLDGLDDGFIEADNHAMLFRKLISGLKIRDVEHGDEYKNMQATFEQYYQAGKKMAQSYIDNGPKGGNMMMAQFDSVAAQMGEQINSLLLRMNNRVESSLANHSQNINSSASLTSALLSFILIAVFFCYFLMRRILNVLGDLAIEAQSMAKGDLRGKLNLNYKKQDEVGILLSSIDSLKSHWRELVVDVNHSINELSEQTDFVSKISNDNCVAIQSQQQKVHDIAQSMQSMARNTEKIEQNAHRVVELSSEAENNAASGQLTVKQAVSIIAELSIKVAEASATILELQKFGSEINSIVDVIKGISGQTNLLALNAAIEAARAGETGRGFAVVADEVRELASRSEESASKIQLMIEQLHSVTIKAVEVMQVGNGKSEQTVEQIQLVDKALANIQSGIATLNEMNSNIEQTSTQYTADSITLADRVSHINDMFSDNALVLQKTSQRSDQLHILSEKLSQKIQYFKVD